MLLDAAPRGPSDTIIIIITPPPSPTGWGRPRGPRLFLPTGRPPDPARNGSRFRIIIYNNIPSDPPPNVTRYSIHTHGRAQLNVRLWRNAQQNTMSWKLMVVPESLYTVARQCRIDYTHVVLCVVL